MTSDDHGVGDAADAKSGRNDRWTILGEPTKQLDRFGAVLVLTIASVAALSLVDLTTIDNELAQDSLSLVLSLTIGLTFVLALRASGVGQRLRRIAEVLVVIAAVVSIVALVIEVTSTTDVLIVRSNRPSALWVLIAMVTPVAMVRRLLQHRRVSRQTLAGAVAAYLMIALASCYLFLTIDGALDDGFFGTGEAATNEFMYFSLVTITTLGYGDLAPVDPIGRLAATSEAVIGQVYLVTFVAMVVGLMIQQRES